MGGFVGLLEGGVINPVKDPHVDVPYESEIFGKFQTLFLESKFFKFQKYLGIWAAYALRG